MNRKILVATHSTFADGIKKTMELIIGKQDSVLTLCAYVDGLTEIETPAKNIIDSLPEDTELIVVTDIFGGSVNNEFLTFLNRKNVFLVAGVNLPLLFELAMGLNSNGNTDTLIRNAVETAKNQIIYCNPLTDKQASQENF